MGSAATDVAKKLNYVMTELYKQVKDVQFMIMGIGDLAYDSAPIQISQFESDIRIAEQLTKSTLKQVVEVIHLNHTQLLGIWVQDIVN